MKYKDELTHKSNINKEKQDKQKNVLKDNKIGIKILRIMPMILVSLKDFFFVSVKNIFVQAQCSVPYKHVGKERVEHNLQK